MIIGFLILAFLFMGIMYVFIEIGVALGLIPALLLFSLLVIFIFFVGYSIYNKKEEQLKKERENLEKFLINDIDFSTFIVKNDTYSNVICKTLVHKDSKDILKSIAFSNGFISFKGLKFAIWCKNAIIDQTGKLKNLILNLKGNLLSYSIVLYTLNNLLYVSITSKDNVDDFVNYPNKQIKVAFAFSNDKAKEVSEFIDYFNKSFECLIALADIKSILFSRGRDSNAVLEFSQIISNDNVLMLANTNDYFISRFLLQQFIVNDEKDYLDQININAKQLKERYDEMNSYVNEANEFISANNLIEKYKKLARNFITLLPHNYMLNKINIRYLNCLILNMYVELKDFICSITHVLYDIEMNNEEKDAEFENIIQNIVDIITNELNLNYNEWSIIVIYLIISENVKRYFAEKAKKIFNIKLNNYLIDYFANSNIVHDDENNIAMLSYYSLVYDTKYNCYEEAFNDLSVNIKDEKNKKKNKSIQNKLLSSNIETSRKININDIDIMTGIEFENFISKLFFNNGYKTNVTKASGDQGIDVILEKNEQKIGIQCKCYSSKVSNSAIQEAVAGKLYYRLDRVMVITNNYFTKSAIELAKINDVELWDRNVLLDKIKIELDT